MKEDKISVNRLALYCMACFFTGWITLSIILYLGVPLLYAIVAAVMGLFVAFSHILLGEDHHSKNGRNGKSRNAMEFWEDIWYRL